MGGPTAKDLLPCSYLIGSSDLNTEASHLYCAVKFGTSTNAGKLVICSVAGEAGLGPLQQLGEAGESSHVEHLGAISNFRLGGTVTEGDWLTTDANGKYVEAAYGQHVHGRALASGVSGDVISGVVMQGVVDVVTYHATVSLVTADNNVVWRHKPGFAGKIVKIDGAVQAVTTDTTGKKVQLTPAIADTVVTGGLLTFDTDVTAADPDTLGKLMEGTAITALNTFTASQEIEINANNFTVFTDGAVNVTLTVEKVV